MKKMIRLTESELKNVIESVLKEDVPQQSAEGTMWELQSKINRYMMELKGCAEQILDLTRDWGGNSDVVRYKKYAVTALNMVYHFYKKLDDNKLDGYFDEDIINFSKKPL